VLAIGAPAVALNNWSSNALRIVGRIRPLVASNVVYVVAAIGVAEATAGRGLLWLGGAFGIGNLVSGLVAVAYLPRGERLRTAKPADEPAAVAEGRQAVAGWTDETVPLSLPWVVRDMRRTVRPPLPHVAGIASGDGDGAGGVRGFGGDIAVRRRPDPPEDAGAGQQDRQW
jgi:hypothetical protein